jgi:hypothetical protein
VSVVSGRLPALDPSEPISPELVLVCPELRDLALARAREFPAPQPFRPPRARASVPDSPERAPIRRRAGGTLLIAAAAVFVLAALAVASGFTGGEGPQLAPNRPQRAAGPNREPRLPVPQRPARNHPKPRAPTTGIRSNGSADAPPPAKQRGRARVVMPRQTALKLALEAERNVLRSPQFFLELGGEGASFVDPATKFFRPNTTISCSVTRRRRNDSWERVCTLRRGRVSLRVRYIPAGRSSFRLAALPAAS